MADPDDIDALKSRLEMAEVEQGSALRESEARHRLLIESWAQAVWETDPNGSVVTDSPSWRAYTGQTLEEWRGYGWLDAIHPDDRAYAEQQWREAVAVGGLVNAEFRLRAPDGGWRWTNVRAAPVFNEARRIEKWAGINIDIDVRKRAEAALIENEERQAFLLQLSDALAPLTDAADIQAEATRRLAEQFDVGWCYFNEYDDRQTHATVLRDSHRDDLRSMAGVHDLSSEQSYLDLMFSGGVLDMPDLTTSEHFSAQAKTIYGQMGIRSALGAPVVRDGRLAAVLLLADTRVRAWSRGEANVLRGAAERTWAAAERAKNAEALRTSEARFQQFADASTSVLWIRNAATMRMEFASLAFDRTYGIPAPGRGGDDRLRTWARLIEAEGRKEVLANFRSVRDGEQAEVAFRIRRASDGALRWIHGTDFPLRDGAGNVRWIAGIGTDITEAKEAADRQGVLVAELQHRTRNLIAVVRSLSKRTIENAASLEDFGERFGQRLAALARVQGLLSHLAAGERVTFDELLTSELSAHGGGDGSAQKITLEGPAGVELRSATVQTLALAIHELATNALKYGALAPSGGHLTVRWSVGGGSADSPPQLQVEWWEHGVVMPDANAAAPSGTGYGRQLIERALPYQMKAETTYELGVDGVRCTIALPIGPALGERS